MADEADRQQEAEQRKYMVDIKRIDSGLAASQKPLSTNTSSQKKKSFIPQLKIKILEVLSIANGSLFTVKEIADNLNINHHNIGQQLHSYRLQGLVHAIKEEKVKALHYEISEKGIKRLDFLKNQNNKIMA